MARGVFLKHIGAWMDLVGSAMAVGYATRERRDASEGDLRRLGIDPEQFRRIGRS